MLPGQECRGKTTELVATGPEDRMFKWSRRVAAVAADDELPAFDAEPPGARPPRPPSPNAYLCLRGRQEPQLFDCVMAVAKHMTGRLHKPDLQRQVAGARVHGMSD